MDACVLQSADWECRGAYEDDGECGLWLYVMGHAPKHKHSMDKPMSDSMETGGREVGNIGARKQAMANAERQHGHMNGG